MDVWITSAESKVDIVMRGILTCMVRGMIRWGDLGGWVGGCGGWGKRRKKGEGKKGWGHERTVDE